MKSLDIDDDLLATIFRDTETIAIVGLSNKTDRPSNDVGRFLQARGYDCVGVNPGFAGQSIDGVPVFASLSAVDRPIDMVDIFRSSDAVAGLVDEALALVPRPRIIWTQLGVIDDAAADKARAAGLTVVTNRCPKIEISRLSRHR